MSKSDVEEAVSALKNEVEKQKPRCPYCGQTHNGEDCLYYDANRSHAFIRGALSYIEPFRNQFVVSLELLFQGIRMTIVHTNSYGLPLEQTITIPWAHLDNANFNPLIAVFDSIRPKQR